MYMKKVAAQVSVQCHFSCGSAKKAVNYGRYICNGNGNSATLCFPIICEL